MNLILLILPNLYYFYIAGDFYIFFLSIASIIFIYSLIKETKYSVLLFPFTFLVPYFIFFIHTYKSNVDEHLLGIIIDSNKDEIMSFIGEDLIFLIFFNFFWFLFVVAIVYIDFKKNIKWLGVSCYSYFLVFLLLFIFLTYLHSKTNKIFDPESQDEGIVFFYEKNLFLEDLKKTYPLGLFVSIQNLYEDLKIINNIGFINKDFNFNVIYSENHKYKKEIFILVIGETSRRKNWQINGYTRKTNPFLSKEKNLINLEDFISIESDTRASIPMILTRKKEIDVHNMYFPEKSIISLFKEAGFKTYWISNQQKIGSFDTVISMYANEADEVIYINPVGYSGNGKKDMDLLDEINKKIDSEDKIFMVIHTLGSHYDYAYRYTDEYDYFKPSLRDVKSYSINNIKYKENLVNSYDNSIRYTDHFLKKIIDKINDKNYLSFMLYTSDHGESIFDGSCKLSGHGHRTKDNLDIAGFVWYSDFYQLENEKKIHYLKNNRSKMINQTSIFPTLADAANIEIKDKKNERSLLSDFSPYPRLVFGGTDYDKANFIGECREIK